MKNIVITGVSTGIGYSSAKILTSYGYKVFGSVRNKNDATKLKNDFGDNFIPLIFDVTDVKSIKNSVSIVKDNLGSEEFLSGLVNNAGVAMGGPITQIDTKVFRKQFDINFFGLIDVTKSFLPLLGIDTNNKNKGIIINISSVSGKRAHPFVAPYSASKFALEAFSDSLRRELMLYGIDVVLIEPGPIKTAIWDKIPDIDNNEFIGSDYELSLRRFYKLFIEMGKKGLDADIIGNKVLKVLETPKPKTRYVITPNKFFHYTLQGLLPDRLLDKMIGKGLGLIRKK
tara:strand:+ start:580 stop:1434 length:855 start_codon:yes stop_codon:yes gene_type:complete